MTYTVHSLAERVKRTEDTIRTHIRNGWLKAEKVPGAKGWRITEEAAVKWADKYPLINLQAEPKA